MRILPLFIPHQGCPFACIYCNQFSITQSKDESIAYFQKLIADFCHQNTAADKEVAFFGGTFTALSRELQEEYFDLAAPYISSLRGIRLSTRPDALSADGYKFLKDRGVSTIELGIQSFSDEVLIASRRGYSAKTAVSACESVKTAGFDLVIQLMPGLPSDTFSSFSATIDQAIELQPQGIRLYPTVVLEGTRLADWYAAGKYAPLSLEEAISWLKTGQSRCSLAGINVIKTGLHSDLRAIDIVAGPHHPAIGELVQIELLYDELISKWQPDMTLEIPGNKKSLFLGHGRKLVNMLKKKLLLDKIAVTINKENRDIEYVFKKVKAQYYW
ncbi:MAG: radical SAM protein [Candidatus Cloacimonetes bacterium]|nr:radical SAM protein [Candidatus Cloacimonadota bacterium]